MKPKTLAASISLIFFSASAAASPTTLSPADQAAAFKAAGFTLKGKQWRACDDPTPSYTPGTLQEVRDLNGDGQPEAVITEGGTYAMATPAPATASSANRPTAAGSCSLTAPASLIS